MRRAPANASAMLMGERKDRRRQYAKKSSGHPAPSPQAAQLIVRSAPAHTSGRRTRAFEIQISATHPRTVCTAPRDRLD
jgi:hypothetical protein